MNTRVCVYGAMVVLGILASAPAARAQDPPQPDRSAPRPESPPRDIREQTIYIPFTKLKTVFEKQGRGVFLPYDQFQELWKKARAADTPERAPQPPAGALISEIESVVSVSKDTATVNAKLSIDLLRAGWQRVPLRLADAAILSAKQGNANARIVPDGNRGYALLVEKKGDQAERITLSLQYAKAITKTPGQNRVAIQTPQAPVNRWRIEIPEKGVKVNVQPLIAAAETPADENKEQTVVLAFVGAAPTVAIDWTPKAEGASGLAALATVKSEQTVTIDEGVVRTRTQLAYSITRAELSQLLIDVPADHKVAGVFDPNVRQWEVKKADGKQTIQVQLFQPARTQQNLIVDLEKFLDEKQAAPIAAPVVEAKSVARQQGVVVVAVAGTLRAEAQNRSGLIQLDRGDIPASLRRTQWSFAYRYAALPYTLSLSVERLQPRIETTELVEAYLTPERMTLDLFVLYRVQRVGVFQLRLQVPEGYQVRRVLGRKAAGASAATVDGYNLEGEKKTDLVVNLSRRAFGAVGLWVQLEKQLNDPNLLTPTGNASDIVLPVPRSAPQSVEHSTRKMIVYAPESLRVSPAAAATTRPIEITTALQGVASTRDGRIPEARPMMAFAYGGDVTAVNVKVQRRRPHITASQLLEAKIDAGVVKYTTRFFFQIRYSGVKRLRIDVPQAIANEIGDQAGRGRAMDPQPDDVAEGDVAWQLISESEFSGQHTATFQWERKIDQLEVGKTIQIAVPVLKPRNVDRAWGQIVLAKAETLDIRPAEGVTGLQPKDPRHDLMPQASAAIRNSAARAYEFHQDWNLTIEATRYQLEQVKRTSIEMAVIRMVVTRSDQIAVQALYRLRSAQQRLVFKLPNGVDIKNAFDTQPLRINGKPVALEQGDKGDFYVPLAGLNSDTPFLMELRYTATGDQRQLELPAFPAEPAMQKVYLCAYLPDERLLLGSFGQWTNEAHQGIDTVFQPKPGYRSDDHLVQEVLSGLPVREVSNFPKDGSLHIFSALRPAPPPDGSLRLVAARDMVVYGGLFGVLAAVCLALLARPVTEKIAALGLSIAFVLMLGVLLPTFTSQLMRAQLIAGLGAVAVIWTTYGAVTGLRGWSSWLSSPEDPAATAAPQSDEAATPFQQASEAAGEATSPDSEPGIEFKATVAGGPSSSPETAKKPEQEAQEAQGDSDAPADGDNRPDAEKDPQGGPNDVA